MTVRNDVGCVKALSGFIPIWVEPRESGSRPFQGRELFVYPAPPKYNYIYITMIGTSKPCSVNRDGDPPAERFP